MRDLVEFLCARLDEDEDRARSVQREQGDHASPESEPWRLSWHDEYDLLCIDPSRALAEVEAKRRIVFLAERLPALTAEFDLFDNNRDAWSEVLKRLALPYASHPEYDESWRP